MSKVPQVTLAFWAIKILATTLGETAGDAVTMTWNLGYAKGSLIFLAAFAVALTAQLSARRCLPALYWAVVVTTTTVGTTMSDYLDRSLGLGYPRASALLLGLVLLTLAVWRLTRGRVQFQEVTGGPDEAFYWLTILLANTLGTALGDFTADDLGFGFGRAALLFAGLLVLVVGGHFAARRLDALWFWAAYILTRPFGATLGDTLTKPLDMGGLDLGRIASSLVLGLAMMLLIQFHYDRKRGAR